MKTLSAANCSQKGNISQRKSGRQLYGKDQLTRIESLRKDLCPWAMRISRADRRRQLLMSRLIYAPYTDRRQPILTEEQNKSPTSIAHEQDYERNVSPSGTGCLSELVYREGEQEDLE